MSCARTLTEEELQNQLRLANESIIAVKSFAELHVLAHRITALQLELARRALTGRGVPAKAS